MRLAVVGSGSWGTTMSIVLAENISKFPEFDQNVKTWLYEEVIDGRKLSEIINNDHINPKYLPGISLPNNLIGCTDMEEVVKGATHLVFVFPHQFTERIVAQVKPHVSKDAVGISLIKGLMESGSEIKLISEFITQELGIHMSVLSGANIAMEIAKKTFGETTIASDRSDLALLWKKLFEKDYLKIGLVDECFPVEICGAVKNCIALAAGFMEALNQGFNTKAAVLRIGFMEIISFCEIYKPVKDKSIFFHSFGIADLIATCGGGRNRRVAEEYIKTGKDFLTLEAELLNGQKLQGPGTLEYACGIIKKKQLESKFPLLMGIYNTIFEQKPADHLLTLLLSS